MSTTSVYREIDVKTQHAMSLRETWILCIRSVKHRLFRSMLTLAVVVLAVAFFMFLLSESLFQRSIANGVLEEESFNRLSQTTLTRMLSNAPELTMVHRLSNTANLLQSKNAEKVAQGKIQLEEYARVSGLDVATIEQLAQTASREVMYTTWLADLPTGHRLNLIGKRSGRQAIEYILANSQDFHDQLKIKIEIRIPGKIDTLDAFLAAYPTYKSQLGEFNKRWNNGVSKAVERTLERKGDQKNVPDNRWIAAADAQTIEAWRKDLADIGFQLTPELVATIQSQLKDANMFADLVEALNRNTFRIEWAREFNETKRSSAEEKMPFLTDKRAIKLLKDQFSPEVLENMKTRYERVTRLSLLNNRLAIVTKATPSFLGLTGRQLFLLFISFLVCMVGITNAMLMSITERYREIATMKCLGATDSYILSQFMMEAALQGTAGGIIGVVLGFIISTVRCTILYGSYLWTYFPAVDLLYSAIFSLVAGVLLSALASVQPSWSASRMAPMEAMRVE